MFEFMHKYRIPVLVLCLLALFGFGAWGAISSLFEGGPSGENPVVGTFKVPGTQDVVEIRAREFAEMYGFVSQMRANPYVAQYLQSIFPESNRDSDLATELMTWDALVAARAGKAAGVPVSDFDVYGEKGKPEDARTVGNVEVHYEFQRALKYVTLLRSGSLGAGASEDPGGGEYAAVAKDYPTNRHRVRVASALFEGRPLASYVLDLTKAEDKDRLLEFWEKNKARLQAAKPQVEQMSVEAMVVRHFDVDVPTFTKTFEEKYADATKDVVVTEEEILARWKLHQTAYDHLVSLETERRKKEGLNSGDQPSELELVRPRIVQEIKLGHLLRKTAKEVDALVVTQSCEDLAKAAALPFVKLENKDSTAVQSNPDIGKPRWVVEAFRAGREDRLIPGKLFSTENPGGRYLEGIFDQPGDLQALLRPVSFAKTRVPELADIRDYVVEQWQEEQASADLKARAEAFRKSVEDEVGTKLVDRRAELEKGVADAVTAFVEKEKLDREKEADRLVIQRFEDSEKRKLEAALDQEKAKYEKDAFFAVARATEGLELLEPASFSVAPAARTGGFVTFSKDLSPAELRRRLFRAQSRQTQLAAMDVGRMGAVDVQAGANLALVSVLLEKTPPSEADLLSDPEIETLVRAKQKFPAPFTFESIKNPNWFGLVAKEMDDRLAKDAERKAAQERRAARRREEDAARARADAELRRIMSMPLVAPPGGVNPGTGEPTSEVPTSGDSDIDLPR